MRWPGFRPAAIAVTGVTRVPEAAVVAAAAIDRHANIWLADVRAMERRIEAIPYVATAHVHRRLPAAVTIDVAEREPDGCVHFVGTTGAADVTVDATRRVLAAGCDDSPHARYDVRGAPVAPGRTLENASLATLQADRAVLLALGRTFTSLALDRFGGLNATLPDRIVVHFGDDEDLEKKEKLIGPVLAAVANRIDLVAAVDVRAPSAPVVDFR